MVTILSVVLAFLLTGVIGNKLVQRWQSRNWLLQQRFLGSEKEYVALKELADEIAVLLGARIYHMQRLSGVLRHELDETVNTRLARYDEALVRWNERLTSFFVRLPLLADGGMAQELEQSIHSQLAAVGAQLERVVRDRSSRVMPSRATVGEIQRKLNMIQGRSVEFNKALMRVVEKRRRLLYDGSTIYLSGSTLEHFSTWQLFKALFSTRVNTLSVLRSPFDF